MIATIKGMKRTADFNDSNNKRYERQNLVCAKMAPRKGEGCARSGHVTGQRSLRRRGSRKGLQRAPTNTMLFSDYHLAKLNPNCHMNYLDYL